MAYTSPITWSGTSVVTAAQLNEQVRDNMDFVYNSAISAGGVLISTGTASAVSSYTFSSIPSTYKHLMIRAWDFYTVTAITSMRIRFNADTGARYNYHSQGMVNSGSGYVGESASNATALYLYSSSLATTASRCLGMEAFIPNYAGTSFFKIIYGIGQSYGYTVSFGGVWNIGTASISSIELATNSGNDFYGNVELYGYGV